MPSFQTILVAVDFSETSSDTLNAAVALAEGEQRQIHLINVVQDLLLTSGVTETPVVDWQEIQRSWIETARTKLVHLVAPLRIDPHRVTLAVATGAAAAEIVRYADEHAVEVIVLGSHGHGLVRRFMLGSVADRVLRQASCPVMLVPHRAVHVTAGADESAYRVEA